MFPFCFTPHVEFSGSDLLCFAFDPNSELSFRPCGVCWLSFFNILGKVEDLVLRKDATSTLAEEPLWTTQGMSSADRTLRCFNEENARKHIILCFLSSRGFSIFNIPMKMKRCHYSIPLETRITSNNIGFSSREVFLLQKTFSFVTATLSAVTDTQSPLIFPALVSYFNLDVRTRVNYLHAFVFCLVGMSIVTWPTAVFIRSFGNLLFHYATIVWSRKHARRRYVYETLLPYWTHKFIAVAPETMFSVSSSSVKPHFLWTKMQIWNERFCCLDWSRNHVCLSIKWRPMNFELFLKKRYKVQYNSMTLSKDGRTI